MKRVRLIVWNAGEAAEKAGLIRRAGWKVDCSPFDQAALRHLRERPPDAVVIDLDRIPSQGRDVAVGLRLYKDTRRVPIVFVGGEPDKCARIRALLPDATFTRWETIGQSLTKVIEHPPLEPVVPRSRLAAYAGAPLAKKLGIRPNSVVALVGAPAGIEEKIHPLPEGARLTRSGSVRGNLTLWFVRKRNELEGKISHMAEGLGEAGVWILWPKRASGVSSELTQNVVRATGLASGLVDYKVCSFDQTWSGLLFSRRKPKI
jgi:hypothetical protein